MKRWQNLGLKIKVPLGIAITMLVVLGITFFFLSQHFKTLLWDSEIQKIDTINSIAQTLLSDAMMAGRKDIIQDTLNQLGQNVGNQQLYSIAVYDDQYVITSFASGFPGSLTLKQESMPTDVKDPSCWGCHQLPPGERPSHLVVNVEGQQAIRNSVALYNEERCQTCHGTGKQVLGDIIVDFSQDQFKQNYTSVMAGLGGGIALAVLLVIVVLYQVLRRIGLKPIEELVNVAEAISQGDMERRVIVRGGDEIGILGNAINSMVEQLAGFIGTLEQRVADRTRIIEASAEVSRRLSTILDERQLVLAVVNEIHRALNYYHAHIYLVDESNSYLNMVGGTGEAGKLMLSRKHRLPMGQGLVGQAAQTNAVIMVPDTSQDPNWLPNPLLPDTKAEIAVPISIGDQVLGVLDIQHNIVNGLSEQDKTLLQSIANQVAIAIKNAQSFTVTQKQVEHQAIINRITQQLQIATTLQSILSITANELGNAFSASQVTAHIGHTESLLDNIRNRGN
jgi:putative methionine-R-sulfoxide reductase with GAF domain